MCNESSLATVFGAFSGRAVKQEPSDLTVISMHKTARRNGYLLRLIWGNGNAQPEATDHKRATAHIDRQPDGSWAVSTRFYTG